MYMIFIGIILFLIITQFVLVVRYTYSRTEGQFLPIVLVFVSIVVLIILTLVLFYL